MYKRQGVSACAVCDGFFHRGKPVAVLGSGDFAASEAAELVPLAASVTILTNGQQPTADFGSLPVVTTPIARLTGDQLLQGAELEDGSFVPLSGLFVALGKASAVDLARAAGILTCLLYTSTYPTGVRRAMASAGRRWTASGKTAAR